MQTRTKKGEAVYLIDDASFRMSGWDLDARGQKSGGGMRPVLEDNSTEYGMRFKRDIKPQDSGVMTLETVYSVNSSSGLYFLFTNEEKEEIFQIYTKDSSFWVSDGKQNKATTAASAAGKCRVKVVFDLDAKKADFYLNGAFVGSFDTAKNFKPVSQLVIGTQKDAVVSFYPVSVQLYINYLVNETFITTAAGSLPADWDFAGKNIFVAEIESNGAGGDVNSLKIVSDAGEMNTASHKFTETSGKVVFESYLLLPVHASGASVSLKSGSKTAVKILTKGGDFYSSNGVFLRKYTANIWQCVRIEADTQTQKAFLRIDGKAVGTVDFENAVTSFDNIEIAFVPDIDSVLWFDDVDVRPLYDYADYCPTPVPALSDEYKVGLNICSLWRNGHHQGWDSISPFSDLQTYLGFYDEGLTELADWEIKWMVENGIEYQHLCWYCPSGDLSVPIKKSRMNEALHDGFFNAKYSDLMKFNFMWENTGTNVHSLAQFKEHLWSYWVEYYFTDPRFMTLENKPVITIWSYRRFMEAFGNTEEGALEAMNFMKEDIKKYGFDGMIVLFADGHNMAKPVFEQMARIGADGTYGYHWNKTGFEASHQIYRMTTQQDFDVLHIVPTTSVGFNNVGWAGTRSELITLDEHKQVLSYIKDTFLKKYDETSWKSKSLLISTWNEYGEGTYVMPSNVHGFGYLNNIREVIVGTEKGENVRPTAEQLDRVGYLYSARRTPIRRLDYEAAEPAVIPEQVVRTWDFANSEDTKAWRVIGGIENFDNTKGVLSGTGIHVGGQIINDEELGLDASSIPFVHVRLKAAKPVGFRVVFITEDDTEWNAKKIFNEKIKKVGDFADYYVDMRLLPTWAGKIKQIRIDPMTAAGDFAIASVALLNFTDTQKEFYVEIDGERMSFDFAPSFDNCGNVYVTFNPAKGIFGKLRLYHEFSRFTGKLIVASPDKEFVFTVGSATATINGKAWDLPAAFTLKDGLPVLPLNLLLEKLGVSYRFTEEKLTVSFAD